jgi:cardiolipin synthase
LVSSGLGRVPGVQAPRFVGAGGPLSPDEVTAQVAHLTHSPTADALLLRHIAIEQGVTETPLLTGETIRLLPDGPTTFRAIFAAIRAARHEVDLEYYIVEDVESDGTRLGDLLVDKRREGVAVNVIYDSIGSLGTPHAFFRRLSKAGVNLVEYNPLNPFKARTRYSPNHRDHRKILLVDGASAIVGGVNLDHDHQAGPVGGAAGVCGKAAACMRDADLEIEGPAVAELQTLFLRHWRAQRGPPIEDPAPIAANAPAGDDVVRIIASSPGRAGPRYYVTLIAQLRSAVRSIIVETAYFAPTRDEMKALEDAARRGVEVQVLLPDHGASRLATAFSRSRYGELLTCGVKVYETRGVDLHSKLVSVDGVWSVVGSSNIDQRSVVYNDEVDAVVLGDQTAGGFQSMFETDRAIARPVDLETWRRRPPTARLMELFARALQAWL